MNCAVIFLSNLDFQDPKVLRTHGVAAVKSRSILAPISFDPLALYEYTGWLCTAGGMLRRVFVDHKIGRTITGRKGERITITRANARWFITHEEANHVLEHFAKYAARYPSIGPRELVKFARLRIGADPSEWESWIAKQLTREPVWVLPAPLYVYRFSETPPPAPPPLPEPVSGGVASGPTGAAPASPLSGSAASVPPTFSKKRGAGSSFDRDAYMTCIEVAQPIYAQAERILAQEGIDLSGLWWAEVCAGSGNILRQMPVDRRLGWDINPLDNGAFGIVQADYTKQRLDPSKKWFVGLVAPHFFQRHAIENKLHPYFHRVHREIFRSDSFLRDGQKKYIPSIFDIWIRRDYMRDVVVVRTEYPDWVWLPAKQMGDADYWMQCYGVGFGDLKRPDNLGMTDDPSWHWFIRELRPGTIDRLKRLDWQAVAYPTVTTPRIHKPEVVRAYSAAYGDSEADDYNTEDGGAGENVVAQEATSPPAAYSEAHAADPTAILTWNGYQRAGATMRRLCGSAGTVPMSARSWTGPSRCRRSLVTTTRSDVRRQP